MVSTALLGDKIVYAGAGTAPVGMIDYRTRVAATPELEDIREPEPDDLAGLFYTSGTTGGPKAAMLSQRNLYANAMSMLLTAAMLCGLLAQGPDEIDTLIPSVMNGPVPASVLERIGAESAVVASKPRKQKGLGS